MVTYRHSGAMPPLGILLIVATGVVASCVLGVIYSFVRVYIPIIYFNFLFALALGWAIGRTVILAAKTGKVRNTHLLGIYGAAFGLLALYAAWASPTRWPASASRRSASAPLIPTTCGLTSRSSMKRASGRSGTSAPAPAGRRRRSSRQGHLPGRRLARRGRHDCRRGRLDRLAQASRRNRSARPATAGRPSSPTCSDSCPEADRPIPWSGSRRAI